VADEPHGDHQAVCVSQFRRNRDAPRGDFAAIGDDEQRLATGLTSKAATSDLNGCIREIEAEGDERRPPSADAFEEGPVSAADIDEHGGGIGLKAV
jgi:hypothetical protein